MLKFSCANNVIKLEQQTGRVRRPLRNARSPFMIFSCDYFFITHRIIIKIIKYLCNPNNDAYEIEL